MIPVALLLKLVSDDKRKESSVDTVPLCAQPKFHFDSTSEIGHFTDELKTVEGRAQLSPPVTLNNINSILRVRSVGHIPHRSFRLELPLRPPQTSSKF